jgi:hypothetical protein
LFFFGKLYLKKRRIFDIKIKNERERRYPDSILTGKIIGILCFKLEIVKEIKRYARKALRNRASMSLS